MQKACLGLLALCAGNAMLVAQAGGAGGSTTILEQAPTDHSIAIPNEKLSQYLKDMDGKKLTTLRIIEGGKFNVNIRRITKAETALVHPNTIDTWVVIEGGGTLTSGGKLENGKSANGVSNPLKVGDVVFIPSGLPHAVSGVNGNITWLSIRWDDDYPAAAEPGAGNLPVSGRGAVAAGGREGRAGPGAGGGPLEYAPNDRAVYIPKEKLDAYMRDMDANDGAALRLIQGGLFSVNIRRQTTPSTELHSLTANTWVVLRGGGTVNTNFRNSDGKRVEGTGVLATGRPGDVFFIPRNLTHGFSSVDGAVYWLNLRWDVNW
jgi:mannose-6-phosphate isomerase-like protein (cupin superfamily)